MVFYQHSLKAGECARIYTHTQDKQAMLCSPGIILRISRSSSLSNMLSHKTRTKSPKHAKSLRSCPTLCNPMNHSLPGSSVHGILQTRILEWVVISFSRDSHPRDRTLISYISCMSGWFFITSTRWELCVVSNTFPEKQAWKPPNTPVYTCALPDGLGNGKSTVTWAAASSAS